MNIVLIGYRGSGKSTVGKRLAACLEMEFVDTDDLLQQRQQAPIHKIVKCLGWEHFRKVEKEIIEEISAQDDLVIAAGDDRHGRNRGLEGFSHTQAFDIEAPSAEETGNPGQDSELIFH